MAKKVELTDLDVSWGTGSYWRDQLLQACRKLGYSIKECMVTAAKTYYKKPVEALRKEIGASLEMYHKTVGRSGDEPFVPHFVRAFVFLLNGGNAHKARQRGTPRKPRQAYRPSYAVA